VLKHTFDLSDTVWRIDIVAAGENQAAHVEFDFPGAQIDPRLTAEGAPGLARQFVIGAICAIAAVAIWAGWLVMMRLGVTTTLTAFDLTALRYAVTGIVLLPVVLRRGLAFNRLGWLGLTAVIIGVGAPVPLLIGTGLSFAPVTHASVLTYGIAPLIVACVAGVALKERLVSIRKSGLVLVGLGALVIGGLGMLSFDGRQSVGHLLFLTADCLWAGYAVVMRRARLDGLHAAAIAAVSQRLRPLTAACAEKVDHQCTPTR